MMEPCTLCDDTGMRVVERVTNGVAERVAVECSCRVSRRAQRAVAAAKIPQRYEHCTLDSYNTGFGLDNSLSGAKVMADNFVHSYPLANGNGLLLTGSLGVGKTHLGVGILQALIAKGARGLFVDYRDLLKQVQHSYNRSNESTEMGVLEPVFRAEVLLLDELGAVKPSDWVWDTVAHILNTRYNERLTTIITTNYPNLAAGAMAKGVQRGASKEASREFQAAQEATREGTLGDRIGDRMLSRLQEMCVVVEMRGQDFRQSVKRARFA
jgi:DNA replication protein DnaC